MAYNTNPIHPIFLGIDNTKFDGLRIVGLTIDEAWDEELLFAIRYRGEYELDKLWLQLSAYGPPKAVATTMRENDDPFYLLTWLGLQNQPVYHYYFDQLPRLREQMPEIASRYALAARLAIKLAFQLDGFRKLGDFKEELDDLNDGIGKLHGKIHDLFRIVPCPF